MSDVQERPGEPSPPADQVECGVQRSLREADREHVIDHESQEDGSYRPSGTGHATTPR